MFIINIIILLANREKCLECHGLASFPDRDILVILLRSWDDADG